MKGVCENLDLLTNSISLISISIAIIWIYCIKKKGLHF